MSADPLPPKVLVVANQASRVEAETIIGCRSAGIDVHVALESTSPHIGRLVESDVPVRELNLKSNFDPAGILTLHSQLKDSGFHIAHGLANKPVANLAMASISLPVKVIAYRGAVGHVSKWDPACYLKWFNPKVDYIVCVSDAVKTDLFNSGVKISKLKTIYKGHDVNWYTGATRESARQWLRDRSSIPEHAILCGLTANMRRVKGADILLKAIAQLPPDFHAVLIGAVRDPLISELSKSADLSGRVHFLGEIKNAWKLTAGFDLNIAPSRGREGLTKAIIEGMAQHIPCIVSDAGGLPELIEDEQSGLVIPQNSPDALANAISRLTADQFLAKSLAVNAYNRLKSKFSIDKTIQVTAEFYKSAYMDLLKKERRA